MGEVTREPGVAPLFALEQRNGATVALEDGAQSANGQVLGTLLHGVLANDVVRSHLLSHLWQRRGLTRETGASEFAPQRAYDQLADALAAHLDLTRVASWLARPAA